MRVSTRSSLGDSWTGCCRGGRRLVRAADAAEGYGEALVRGTPNRSKIALTVLSDKVKKLI
jgi:hypothetical protein